MSVRTSDIFSRFLSKILREGPDKPDKPDKPQVGGYLSGLSGATLNIFFIELTNVLRYEACQLSVVSRDEALIIWKVQK